MANNIVETIVNGLEPIALVIRAEYDEAGLHFFTPPSFSQQVAVMSHPKGKRIPPHVHNLVSRQVLYTQEVLLVRRGKVKINLYSSEKQQIVSLILTTGDVILLCGGGHSFEMLEDSSLIEVKQGPYAGENDKTIFQESGTP
jgi:mannose-6-phosphate isomerase-like protein (cupin superfamily)